MKLHFIIIFLFTAHLAFSQIPTTKERYSNINPEIRLGIWDKENTDPKFNVDTLIYEDIPKYLDYKGTVIEALTWKDSLGCNILIQSVSGFFQWRDYEPDSTDFQVQDKSEIYAYLFQKKNGDEKFKMKRRMYDFNHCFGVDWYTGFIPKATTITDVDKDGVAEVSMPYVLICRGGMDPGFMKIIMYEDSSKFALRGSTMICFGEHSYGGEYKASDNLKEHKLFSSFLIKRWDTHKCEENRFN